MTFDDLQRYIRDYSPYEKAQIIHAYEYACVVHFNQKRKSGEPYIIHPLYVGCLLAEMNADADTICAGLLHDVIEDGKGETKEKLEKVFNHNVALLVDGVTKINKIEFDNDAEKANAANYRKIVESLLIDVRIFIIKLADRLHNMLTLEFHNPNKQYEISNETMELFVPFASLLGEFKVKTQLEDLAFKYMNPHEYSRILEEKKALFKNRYTIRDMVNIGISQDFNSIGLPFYVYSGEKSIYTMYKKCLKKDCDLADLHNLLELKYIFDDSVYESTDHFKKILNAIFRIYRINDECPEIKNYIKNPKLNMYKAIHASIISPSGFSLQVQLQTKDMYKTNTYGLTAYWKMLRNSSSKACDVMQDKAREVPGFIDYIKDISAANISDQEFNEEIRESILNKKVSVTDELGNSHPLPIGSSLCDYIIKYSTNPFNIEFATVNGVVVPYDHILNNNDSVVLHYMNKENGIDYEPFFKTHQGKRLYLEKK